MNTRTEDDKKKQRAIEIVFDAMQAQNIIDAADKRDEVIEQLMGDNDKANRSDFDFKKIYEDYYDEVKENYASNDDPDKKRMKSFILALKGLILLALYRLYAPHDDMNDKNDAKKSYTQSPFREKHPGVDSFILDKLEDEGIFENEKHFSPSPFKTKPTPTKDD